MLTPAQIKPKSNRDRTSSFLYFFLLFSPPFFADAPGDYVCALTFCCLHSSIGPQTFLRTLTAGQLQQRFGQCPFSGVTNCGSLEKGCLKARLGVCPPPPSQPPLPLLPAPPPPYTHTHAPSENLGPNCAARGSSLVQLRRQGPKRQAQASEPITDPDVVAEGGGGGGGGQTDRQTQKHVVTGTKKASACFTTDNR